MKNSFGIIQEYMLIEIPPHLNEAWIWEPHWHIHIYLREVKIIGNLGEDKEIEKYAHCILFLYTTRVLEVNQF